MNNIDIYDLSFNELEQDVRFRLLKPIFINPFNLPNNTKLINPFTFERKDRNGNNVIWDNGIHIIHNVFTFKIYRKILVENNRVTKVWSVNEINEYKEVNPYKNGTWDCHLF